MAKKKELAKTEPGALMQTPDFGEFAGQGFQNQTSDDVAIPFLGLIQKLSPELDESSDRHIPGAKEGRMFNSVTLELLPEEVVLVPCYTEHAFVQFIPRDQGGGFVGQHAPGSDIVKQAQATAEAFNKLRTPEGHELVETFYMYGLILDDADAPSASSFIVVAFSSTKIKVYRRINTLLRTVKGNPPLFAHRIAVTAAPEKNKQGQPYMNFRIAPVNGNVVSSLIDPNGPQSGLLKEGQQFLRAVSSGTAKAAHESQPVAPADEDPPF